MRLATRIRLMRSFKFNGCTGCTGRRGFAQAIDGYRIPSQRTWKEEIHSALQAHKAHSAHSAHSTCTPLAALLAQLHRRQLRDLRVGLSYESTPESGRAVRTTQTPTNEVLLVAHAAPPNRLSLSGGFAVACNGDDEQPLVVSCVHTLSGGIGSVSLSEPNSASASEPNSPSARANGNGNDSATLLISCAGGRITDIRYAEAVHSSQPQSDLVYYKPSASIIGGVSGVSSAHSAPLRTLPINPYPPPPGTEVAVWRPPATPGDTPAWTHGSIHRYTTPNGKMAQAGTYDHLANVEIDGVLPELGASGSPVVERESGAVCAVVRGSVGGLSGAKTWATPAEHLWECFDLPGMPMNNAPTSDHKLRAVVRKLPPNLPEDVFYSAVQAWVNGETTAHSYYAKGKLRGADSSKESVASRAYITFNEHTQLLNFHAAFDGHTFRDKQGRESKVSVEYAPFQKTPAARHKVDDRQGTIDQDGDFLSFLQSLQATPTKPDFEANWIASRAAEKPKTTPLLLHLAQRKEKSKAKRDKARQKQQRKAAERGGSGTGVGVGGSSGNGSNAPPTKSPADPSSSASKTPAQPRGKKTRGEKRAAKKVREGISSPSTPKSTPGTPGTPSTPPIKILARPDAPDKPAVAPSAPPASVTNSNNNSHTQSPTLDAPKGPRGGKPQRGRPPRSPRGRGRGRGGKQAATPT
ncbi:hypothetical protein E3P91_01683 [Wallemia ichthyophaga]|nr:hypothetical protein E3P91_01683 [Wallemia ichthyophaga]